MSVVLYEAAVQALIHSTLGPVGIDTARRVDQVREKAVENASGAVLNIRSGRLVNSIQGRVYGTPAGVVGVVSSDAFSTWHGQPFSYPSFQESVGRRWLTQALRAAEV